MKLLKNYYCKRTESQRGFTLIELMISMLIGLVAIGAAGSLFLSTLRGSNTVVQATQLHNEINSVLTLLANDIRRAGYWSGSISGADAKNNPFSTVTISSSGDCILYSYDAQSDGTPDPGSVGETDYFGFKLDSGRLKMRTALGASDTPTSCVAGTWEDVTLQGSNRMIQLSNLTFSDEADPDDANDFSGSYCINNANGTQSLQVIDGSCGTPSIDDVIAVRRVIAIQATATLPDDQNTLTMTLNSSVILGNDQIYVVE